MLSTAGGMGSGLPVVWSGFNKQEFSVTSDCPTGYRPIGYNFNVSDNSVVHAIAMSATSVQAVFTNATNSVGTPSKPAAISAVCLLNQ
jgi:hypothetical protein